MLGACIAGVAFRQRRLTAPYIPNEFREPKVKSEFERASSFAASSPYISESFGTLKVKKQFGLLLLGPQHEHSTR